MDLPQHTSSTPHYDPDIASEMLRSIAAMNPPGTQRRIDIVSQHLNTVESNKTTATAPEVTTVDEIMTPLIPFAAHQAVPMALVSRPPFGPPSLASLHVPQNAAWTSALRNASHSVLIQTPDLNAQALIPELLAAARRGISVSVITCLGYNDAGELLPMQGGHNEGVAHKLYRDLEREFHDNLDIYSYVAKDQDRPIHNSFKARSCHIKLMIVDGHVAIVGSGNQDSQSWYHSQEINVMIDSEVIVGSVLAGLRRNQNSWKYGAVRKGDASVDPLVGCWVDAEGKLADKAIGSNAGRFAWLTGVKGAVERVRGSGGF
jgi:phosphatidylserine/phosphatidylglycerophosphate/cardiolipin synthase-like enzyme